uniref:Uncharacterized protein n=1 Tax=Arundo donax TaxID=35708 RepID=A0A0A9AQL0_ARUDO
MRTIQSPTCQIIKGAASQVEQIA